MLLSQLFKKRHEELERLPPKLQAIRTTMRNALGIPLDQIGIIYGEQSVGLFAPPVVLGKRIVAASLSKFPIFDYRAQTDVSGSEPGLNKITLPNPYHPKGVETVRLIPEKYDETPTCNIPSSAINLKNLASLLGKIYGSRNSNVNIFLTWLDEGINASLSFAELQDKTFRKFAHEILGLPSPSLIIRDANFDPALFLNDGYQVMKEVWRKLIELANQFQERLDKNYCPIHQENETSFYLIYLKKTEHPSLLRKARLLYQNFELFVSVDPYDKNKIFN